MIKNSIILVAAIACFIGISSCGKSAASSAEQAAAPILRTMYVNALNGLRVRDAPEDGEQIALLKYFTEVSVLEEKETAVTIGDVTGRWSLIEAAVDDAVIKGWVFGGFLTDQMPDDPSFLFGVWYSHNMPFNWYTFRSNNTFNWEVEVHWGGEAPRPATWNLKNNILTLTWRNIEDRVYTVQVISQNEITLTGINGGSALTYSTRPPWQ